jgi:hypothetical protein
VVVLATTQGGLFLVNVREREREREREAGDQINIEFLNAIFGVSSQINRIKHFSDNKQSLVLVCH